MFGDALSAVSTPRKNSRLFLAIVTPTLDPRSAGFITSGNRRVFPPEAPAARFDEGSISRRLVHAQTACRGAGAGNGMPC